MRKWYSSALKRWREDSAAVGTRGSKTACLQARLWVTVYMARNVAGYALEMLKPWVFLCTRIFSAPCTHTMFTRLRHVDFERNLRRFPKTCPPPKNEHTSIEQTQLLCANGRADIYDGFLLTGNNESRQGSERFTRAPPLCVKNDLVIPRRISDNRYGVATGMRSRASLRWSGGHLKTTIHRQTLASCDRNAAIAACSAPHSAHFVRVSHHGTCTRTRPLHGSIAVLCLLYNL